MPQNFPFVQQISVLMVFAFLLSWAPFAVVSWICLHYDDVPVTVKVIPHMASKISCALNPTIFFLTNKVFRQTFIQTFINKKQKVMPSIA